MNSTWWLGALIPKVADWSPAPAAPNGWACGPTGPRARASPFCREGGAGGGGSGAGFQKKPPCLSYQETHPVSVWLLFVAVGYALQLTKNSLKNNHFLSAERRGKRRREAHTLTHTPALPCSGRQLPGTLSVQGLRQQEALNASSEPRAAALEREAPASPAGFCSAEAFASQEDGALTPWNLAGAPASSPGWAAPASAQAWPCSRCRKQGKEGREAGSPAPAARAFPAPPSMSADVL